MTTTTHKSLRGPRAGMIFFRRDERDFETKVNNAVFPALQGGPHEHQIAALATQLKEVTTDEFKAYAKQVRANSKALAARLNELGYTLATGGTDNHLVLCDLRPQGVTGSKVELVCDAASITLNKNAVNGDRSAVSPGGIRLGTVGSEPRVDGPTPPHPPRPPAQPALTTRGFKEDDFKRVADLIDRAVKISVRLQETHGKPLRDFRPAVPTDPEVKVS